MYEYIQIIFDFGDLSEMNRLGSKGWRVVNVNPVPNSSRLLFALMEREHKSI